MTEKGVKSAFFIGADYQAGYEHVGGRDEVLQGQGYGPVYTPLTQLDFRPRWRGFAPKSPTRFLPFWSAPAASPSSSNTRRPGCRTDSFLHRGSGREPADVPGAGRCRGRVDHGHELDGDLDNAANKKFVAAFSAKYNRLPATFAARL